MRPSTESIAHCKRNIKGTYIQERIATGNNGNLS
jgi:hypothetical protein